MNHLHHKQLCGCVADVLNFLHPVRGDSACFVLADRAYECYSQAGIEMVENNPNLEVYTVEEFMPVANQ